MTKHTKKHILLLSMILFSLLLFFCLYSSLALPVYAAKETVQKNGLTFLNDVVGLDLTKYATNTKEFLQDSYFGVVPQENVRYNLEANGSKLDVLCTFANGKLSLLHILESEGSPHMTKSATSGVEMAKDFLSNYQSYSEKSFYGELESMLDNINSDKNLTKTSGNLKFELTNSEDDATLKWTYTSNGVEAPSKCVALSYENGFLKYYLNTWDLYKVGDTTINLSEEEALELAMERAKTYSWKVLLGNDTVEISNFNVTKAKVMNTIFCSSINVDTVRSEDLLTLYPMRHVWVSLDKFYPGNVYGIEVYIWADTKEIFHVKERFSTLDPPADQIATINESMTDAPESQASIGEVGSNSLSIEWIAPLSIVALMLGTVSFWLNSKEKLSRSIHLPKLGSFKISGVLFCLLLFSMMVLVPISTVSADKYHGRATIWGAESSGSPSPIPDDNNPSRRKTLTEILFQRSASEAINNYFNNNGYDSSDYQGDKGSFKYNILANISANEANYHRVAVVDFDHGVGRTDYSEDFGNFHFMFEDTVGENDSDPPENQRWINDHMVYDMDVYDETHLGTTFFAFINTCKSAYINETIYNSAGDAVITGLPFGGGNNANGKPVGMPYAWTHRTVGNRSEPSFSLALNMSIDGYIDPDEGKFCYLGFPNGSASLSQTIDLDYPTVPYSTWVWKFFSFALNSDITVNDALDHSSLYNFQSTFENTVLHNNFTAVWETCRFNQTSGQYEWRNWDPDAGKNSSLVVYGNGNIKLYQPLLSVNAYDSSGNPLEVDVKIDDESVGKTGVSERVFATFPDETHNIEVTEPDGYTFQNFTVGVNTYTSKSIDIPVESDLTVTAYFTQEPPPNYPVTVVIDSVPHDGYARYHALTVDNPIPTVFWTGDWHNQNPDAIIAVTASTLHYEETFYLTEGYHNIEYAVSCYVGHWHATITAGGQVVAEQDTDVNNHVTAQINVGGGPPPPQFRLTISTGSGGTTSPQPGDHWYTAGTPVQVTAINYTNYVFDHWSLDGNPYYQNPITVTMNSDHTLQASFTQGTYDISTGSVYLHNGQYYQFEVPFYIDGWEVGPTWITYQVSPGYHTFAVPQVPWGGPGFAVVFQYWVVNGWPGPSDNPIGGTITSDAFLGAVYEVITW